MQTKKVNSDRAVERRVVHLGKARRLTKASFMGTQSEGNGLRYNPA